MSNKSVNWSKFKLKMQTLIWLLTLKITFDRFFKCNLCRKHNCILMCLRNAVLHVTKLSSFAVSHRWRAMHELHKLYTALKRACTLHHRWMRRLATVVWITDDEAASLRAREWRHKCKLIPSWRWRLVSTPVSIHACLHINKSPPPPTPGWSQCWIGCFLDCLWFYNQTKSSLRSLWRTTLYCQTWPVCLHLCSV